ncbi:unnamed protein product [Miscanthus lutarioriparius]|uniref:Uncharacterized protein n=1 Tax=Miscanthus lutarioriparius TaxID=422564 RepID=A0A811SJI5_9POAL|nr:unnamed protein product [Miscanthus lutarioriparius]
MARVREPPMASNDDSASLLVDEWSPPAVTPARGSSPLRRLLHGGKQATTTRPATTTTTTATRSHDVKRFICSPFVAVFRAMSCARDAAIPTCDEQQPGSNNGTAGVAAERRREAAKRRRPSLEQLLRMEARAPPPASARPDHQQRKLVVGKPREAAPAAPYEVISSCAMKGNKEQEPLFPTAPQSHFVAAVSDDGERRRRTTIVPVKLEAGAGGPGRQTNAKWLVVVFASLRACSRAPRINDGKVAVAGRASGKAELFYYRPIPMGRRCRVQHLEESPYGASSDLSSLLELGQM